MVKKPIRRHIRPTCEPFSKILVSGLAPGTTSAGVKCTSNTPFLVYCSTNFSGGGNPPGWGYSVNVKSTGFGMGSGAPSFTVGGVANDEVTITFTPGTTGFITLQTECNAKASISVFYP